MRRSLGIVPCVRVSVWPIVADGAAKCPTSQQWRRFGGLASLPISAKRLIFLKRAKNTRLDIKTSSQERQNAKIPRSSLVSSILRLAGGTYPMIDKRPVPLVIHSEYLHAATWLVFRRNQESTQGSYVRPFTELTSAFDLGHQDFDLAKVGFMNALPQQRSPTPRCRTQK